MFGKCRPFSLPRGLQSIILRLRDAPPPPPRPPTTANGDKALRASYPDSALLINLCHLCKNCTYLPTSRSRSDGGSVERPPPQDYGAVRHYSLQPPPPPAAEREIQCLAGGMPHQRGKNSTLTTPPHTGPSHSGVTASHPVIMCSRPISLPPSSSADHHWEL